MKRLIIINLILLIALNILPKEMKVEAKVVASERKWSQSEQVSEQVTVQVTSRNLDSKRDERKEEISVSRDILQSKPTEISQRGVDFIKQYEGFIPVATRLTGEQHLTLGFGHYGVDVKEGQTITEEQANELLKADLKGYTELVLKKCEYLDLNQSQLDALVSFTYNCGAGNLQRLTANGTRNEQEIAEHLTAYTKSKSEVNRNGLQKRRNAEKEMFEE